MQVTLYFSRYKYCVVLACYSLLKMYFLLFSAYFISCLCKIVTPIPCSLQYMPSPVCWTSFDHDCLLWPTGCAFLSVLPNHFSNSFSIGKFVTTNCLYVTYWEKQPFKFLLQRKTLEKKLFARKNLRSLSDINQSFVTQWMRKRGKLRFIN